MSAADFLFTQGMQNVLRRVLSEPTRSFTLNELLAVAKVGRGSGQRQIEQLLAAGVLREGPRRARQRCIQINTGFFLFPELQGIALKSFGLAEPLRAALAPFEEEIQECFVFGSVARQEDQHTSDVDLMVIGDADLMALTEALLPVEQTIGRPLHLHLYQRDEWATLKHTDPVLAQLAEAPKIRIFPRASPA